MATAVSGRRRAIECGPAITAVELDLHHRIRHQVFVEEQGLFHPTDTDHHDGQPQVIRVLGRCQSVPAGTVRLFPLDGAGELWQGDRLAVLPEFRTHGLGGPLVRFAVATAGALGGREMVAHIQLANVAFFQQLGWRTRGDVEVYVGIPHQPMSIGLGDRGDRDRGDSDRGDRGDFRRRRGPPRASTGGT